MPATAIPREQLLQQLDEERQQLSRGREVIERLPRVTRWRSSDGTHHAVCFSALDESCADAVIDEQIAHYRELGNEFEWKMYAHDRPTDLIERLRRRGFEIGPCEAVMLFDLSIRAGWIDKSDACRVARIEREDQIPAFRRVAEKVFGKDYGFTSKELAEALRRGATDHVGYVAYDGEQPVSIGRLYTHPQSWFAGLYGGETVATHRGRGFYRAVVAARARDAIAAGAKYLSVDALPTSRPILERMGFEWLTDTWPCT